jgi:hypothetical protein
MWRPLHVRLVPLGDITPSFNYVIGQLLKFRGDVETERLGSFEVDDELEFRWMLHWQIGRFGTPKYLIGIEGPLPELIGRIETETKHEPVGSLLANYRLAFGSSSLASCLSRSKVIFVSQSGQV